MITTQAAGVTAAAGTGLTQLLFIKLFTLHKSTHLRERTWGSPVTLSCIAEFSRLLRPVGPGAVSQSPSPGTVSQHPYRSQAWWSITPPTT